MLPWIFELFWLFKIELLLFKVVKELMNVVCVLFLSVLFIGVGIFKPPNPLLLDEGFWGVSYFSTIGITFDLSLLFNNVEPICF